MGVTINKRKSTGDWYVWISHKGQRASRKIGKNYSIAVKAAREFEKQLVLGEFDFNNGHKTCGDNLTFSEFCDDYLKNVAQHRLKYNSWTSYQKIIDLYLKPEWKKRPLTSITRQDVKQLLLNRQSKGIVINNIKICISAIFAEAIEREILNINPAHNLGRFFKKNKPQKKTQFLSKEQSDKLLEVVKNEKPAYYDILFTAFRTGMRMGELLALAWDCVNFATMQIEVKRSFSHNHWDTPKSHKVRYIDMTDKLSELLKSRYENRNKDLFCKINKKQKVQLVFSGCNGNPLNDNVLRRSVFYKMLAKANLPKIRLHDIRHSYASQLLQAGTPVHYVKEQLGHSSIATTVDLYGHCQPGSNRDAINRLD